MPRNKQNKKEIFISWSGENSKQIARELKKSLEKNIFGNAELKCFVSDIDISSGDDWWNKIKLELKNCKLGIVCITKENLKAPWIFFETGAMVARDLKVIPLLVNCSFKLLNETPISSKHMVDFYNQEKFIEMINDINKDLSLVDMTHTQLEAISKSEYEDLVERLSSVTKKLKAMRVFNEKYIYPSKVSTVNINTIYICAPMASVTESEYYDLRNFVKSLKPVLINLGFTRVICPLLDNKDYGKFDGSTKAIKENFVELKQVDSMLIIYPKPQPTSVLVEIGYGLALCKKTVIFYADRLPYILEDAGINIPHIDTRKYSSFDDIMNTINSNGKQLFKRDEED